MYSHNTAPDNNPKTMEADALALAQLIYDIYKQDVESDKVEVDQTILSKEED